MEMFLIFLCFAVGHAFGDLQRVEEDLKARENARKGLSNNVRETVSIDQSLQSKDVQMSAESDSSKEAETDVNQRRLRLDQFQSPRLRRT